MSFNIEIVPNNNILDLISHKNNLFQYYQEYNYNKLHQEREYLTHYSTVLQTLVVHGLGRDTIYNIRHKGCNTVLYRVSLIV